MKMKKRALEQTVSQIKKGDLYVNYSANDGWKKLLVAADVPPEKDVVEVEFLEPREWWAENITGFITVSRLKKSYRRVDGNAAI